MATVSRLSTLNRVCRNDLHHWLNGFLWDKVTISTYQATGSQFKVSLHSIGGYDFGVPGSACSSTGNLTPSHNYRLKACAVSWVTNCNTYIPYWSTISSPSCPISDPAPCYPTTYIPSEKATEDDSGWNSYWLLASAWPSQSHKAIWVVTKWIEELFYSAFPSFCQSTFQMNKISLLFNTVSLCNKVIKTLVLIQRSTQLLDCM